MTRKRFIKILMAKKISRRKAIQLAKELLPGTSFDEYLWPAISKGLARWYRVDWGNVTREDIENDRPIILLSEPELAPSPFDNTYQWITDPRQL